MRTIEEKKEIEYFSELFLNNNYMTWLANFMDKYNEIDDIYFTHNNRHILSEEDILMVSYLKYLFIELNKYTVKNNLNHYNAFCYLLKKNNFIYEIKYNGEGYSCTKYDYEPYLKRKSHMPVIEYNDLKKQYSKQMQLNFDYLEKRVIDALENTDLDRIRYELKRINNPTLVSGVGGSNVVSTFTSKVLREKNGIIAVNNEPRNLIYDSLNGFKNVIACSYSGNNYGVDLAFRNDLKKYLLSNNRFDNPDLTYLEYKTTIPEETSFISLAATLIPISVILK